MKQTVEELVNSLTHYLGALLSVIGLIVLFIHSFYTKEIGYIISSLIYGLALIFLYAMSGTYHIVVKDNIKKLFRKLDHMGIFILISASYTPYIFTVLSGKSRWIVFIIQWTCTLAGIIYKIYFTGRFGFFSTVLYLIMGWMVIFVLKDIRLSLSSLSFRYLVISGVSYSVGTIFYAAKKFKFTHAIWHIFVIVGSLFGYLSIYHIADIF